MNAELHKLQQAFKKNLDLSIYSIKDLKSLNLKIPKRFVAYHYAYFIRIYNSLCDDFPKTLKLLGIRNFKKLIREYIIKHPSEQPSLYEMGQKLPKFLKRKRLSKASKLAELEWLLMESNWQPDPILCDWKLLEQYENLDSIVFEFHPAVRLYKDGKKYYLICRKIKEVSKDHFKILEAIETKSPVATLSKIAPGLSEQEIYHFFFSLVSDQVLSHFRHLQ